MEHNTADLSEDDIYYILFTSGSTGKPKGVQVTYRCLNNFLKWTSSIITRYDSSHLIFLNQAPFSFDLSVMDLYTSLYMGGTLYILNKSIQMSFPLLVDALAGSDTSVWVSTPSFAEMCLSDKKFSQGLMPNLRVFLFCGEVLTNSTALKLIDRFPEAKIINTYGPTESTVAVTEQIVTKELAEKEEPLPIGRAKKNTTIEIWDDNDNKAENGVSGEIIIIGDTVAAGYYNNPEETKKAFIQVNRNNTVMSAYKTGDNGYIDDAGVLYYIGRKDNQIKLNGYRIEIGDIEENILKLNTVSKVVVIPKYRNGRVKYLAAFLTLSEDYNKEKEREKIQYLKNKLREMLPEYMIPKKWNILNAMPVNVNGKIDRKKLEEMI